MDNNDLDADWSGLLVSNVFFIVWLNSCDGDSCRLLSGKSAFIESTRLI